MSDAIREIVSTYELPEILVEHITFRISRDQRFLSLGSYGEKYRYIGDLVESYQKDRVLSRAFSLDAQIEGSSRRTLHDVLKSKEGENYERIQGMSIYSATNLAFSFLGDKERELLLKLRERSRNGETNLESLDILAEFLLIKERVGVLAKILEQDKRFRQPERQIVYVNLDSENPFIQWGRRNYNGDPLGYFRRHQDVYGGMSRWELGKFDCGLYNALKRLKITDEDNSTKKQIDIAIPDKLNRDYEKNPLAFFRDNIKKYRGLSRWQLQCRDKKLYDSLLRYGQLEQAIPKTKFKLRSTEEVNEILSKHSLTNGNSNLAARLLKMRPSDVWVVWKRHGLKAMGGKGGRPKKQQLQKVV